MTTKPVLQQLIEDYPICTIEPYGSVIKIPGTSWNPDWEADLSKVNDVIEEYSELQGDGSEKLAFVLVTLTVGQTAWAQQIKKHEPKPGVVFAPTVEEQKRKRRGGWSHRWTPEEDTIVIDSWNDGKNAAEISSLLKGRSESSVFQELWRLRKDGKVGPRKYPKKGRKPKEAKSIPQMASAKNTDFESTTANQENKIDKNLSKSQFDILSEAYDALSKSYIEQKERLDILVTAIEDLSAELDGVKAVNEAYHKYAANVRSDLVKHKHAVTGEAMLPMEDSS